MTVPYLTAVATELGGRLGSDRPGIEGPMTLEHVVEDAVDCLGLVELVTRWCGAASSSALSADLRAELVGALAASLAHRLGVPAFPGPLVHAARVLPHLVEGDTVDRLTREAVALCGPQPAVARLRTPWATVLSRADEIRDVAEDEWVGRDPAEVAPGGEELVYACGRLLAASALVASAADGAPNAVNAARRYTWRWLRLPLPEAVIPAHVTRTRDLAAHLIQRCAEATHGAPAALRLEGARQ
jgi:hypothetical protein